jgi:hypothetical protein
LKTKVKAIEGNHKKIIKCKNNGRLKEKKTRSIITQVGHVSINRLNNVL